MLQTIKTFMLIVVFIIFGIFQNQFMTTFEKNREKSKIDKLLVGNHKLR